MSKYYWIITDVGNGLGLDEDVGTSSHDSKKIGSRDHINNLKCMMMMGFYITKELFLVSMTDLNRSKISECQMQVAPTYNIKTSWASGSLFNNGYTNKDRRLHKRIKNS